MQGTLRGVDALLARVAWRSLLTGATGHGSWLPAATVKEVVRYQNAKWKDKLHHWVEYPGEGSN